jgi:hypothetical protein
MTKTLLASILAALFLVAGGVTPGAWAQGTKEVVPQATYDKIKDHVSAEQTTGKKDDKGAAAAKKK